MLECYGEYLSGPPEDKFWPLWQKNCEKSIVKHFIKKSYFK